MELEATLSFAGCATVIAYDPVTLEELDRTNSSVSFLLYKKIERLENQMRMLISRNQQLFDLLEKVQEENRSLVELFYGPQGLVCAFKASDFDRVAKILDANKNVSDI